MGFELSFGSTFCFLLLFALYFLFLAFCFPFHIVVLFFTLLLSFSRCYFLFYVTLLFSFLHYYSPLRLVTLLFALSISFSPYVVAFFFMSCYCSTLLLSFLCHTIVLLFVLRYCSFLRTMLLLSSSHCAIVVFFAAQYIFVNFCYFDI